MDSKAEAREDSLVHVAGMLGRVIGLEVETHVLYSRREPGNPGRGWASIVERAMAPRMVGVGSDGVEAVRGQPLPRRQTGGSRLSGRRTMAHAGQQPAADR